MERLAYPVREAAEQLGIGERTVWRYVRSGQLKTARLGGRVLVPRDELQRFIISHVDEAGAPVRLPPPHIVAKAAK